MTDRYTAVFSDGSQQSITCGPHEELWIALAEQVPCDVGAHIEYVEDSEGNVVEY